MPLKAEEIKHYHLKTRRRPLIHQIDYANYNVSNMTTIINRRGRDSNPGTLADYVFSKHARSTTTRPLQRLNYTNLINLNLKNTLFVVNFLRRREGSNLRWPYDHSGFRNRCTQPAMRRLQKLYSVGQRFELWVDLRPQRFSGPPH